ncbi:hypothetical protein B5X24_HaOG206713 [Helicoverpa armigera]|uniref:Uncharacterized protein n=1 Tax=Helicoverpa armigera TaxID=29058 RepID=A0A2W1BLJ5_HELAM|nr:hypothetical protein B5X24_HaOG206713 [Helicoverpa armigera]
MVSIKLLALLAVVAIVAGSPHHKSIKKKVPYAWTVSSSGSSGVTAGAAAAGNAGANAVAFSSLRFLAKGIADRNSLSYKAFKWIGGRTAVSSVNDALDIVLTAAAGVGGLINLWIPGLGSLFSSLVIASARISYCVVGQPSSSHFGLVRDGKANINICANGNYGAKWGWKAYAGDYSNAALVIKAYGLENASAKVNQFLAAKGGLQALDGYEKKIASAIVVVAKLFDRDVKTWSSQDVNTVIAKSTEVLGWLANSYYPRLGGYVLADFLRLGSNKNVVNVGLDLSIFQDQLNQISSYKIQQQLLSGVKKCTDQEFNKANDDDDDDDDDDSDENQSDNGTTTTTGSGSTTDPAFSKAPPTPKSVFEA